MRDACVPRPHSSESFANGANSADKSSIILLTSKSSDVRQKLAIWHPSSERGQLEGQHSSPLNSVATQDCEHWGMTER